MAFSDCCTHLAPAVATGDPYVALGGDPVLGSYRSCVSAEMAAGAVPGSLLCRGKDDEFKAFPAAPEMTGELLPYLAATSVPLPADAACAMEECTKFFAELKEKAETDVIVTTEKASIKGDVLFEGFFCRIKLKVYRKQDGCVVELRRRAGDSFLFGTLFQWLKATLLGNVFVFEPVLRQELIPAASQDRALPHEAIAPLLEMLAMARGAEDSSLRQEVRANLHLFAKKGMPCSAEARLALAEAPLGLPVAACCS